MIVLKGNMGNGSQILHMIFIVCSCILISFHHCTHILVVGASLNAAPTTYNFNSVHGAWERNHHHIEKVSGDDENEAEESFIFQKFRALLGIRRFHRKRQSEAPSPSPSPSPTPAPVPTIRPHFRHRPHLVPRPNMFHKEEKEGGKARRIIVPVLASAGCASVLCLIGLIWGCYRFKKQRRRTSIITSRSKYLSSQNSAKKVNSDPHPDLFYLDSLGTALEPHPFSVKQNTTETLNTYSNQSTSSSYLTVHEVEEESQKEVTVKTESDNEDGGGGSVVGEIVPVGSCSSSPCVDRVMIPLEVHSVESDDESFHSFCNSHTSSRRLSNASAGSLSDTSEIVSPNTSKVSVTSPMNLSTPSSILYCIPNPNVSKNFTSTPAPPPLPPPPPPLPCVHVSSSLSSACSTSKAFSFSTLRNLSSPKSSDSSFEANQTKLALSPPTPKPPEGIYPPPCPPPFSKGGPPPPPAPLPQCVPLGKDGAPLQKLKPLHWDKVRAAPDRSMVWDKLKSSSFELNEEMIGSLFGYNLQNSMKNGEAKSKSPSPSKHVLEPKRLQNITILSKALNVTAEQVCSALNQGGGLCLQELEALVKMEPTKEEEAKLTGYKGDISDLGSAEKLVKAMLNIPFAFLRIEAMLYRETFEDEVVHLGKSFSMLEEACKELRSSRLFLKLLEAVLKTGNRMNVGTIRGGARAFKLDALLKLADVKGTDGKTTLLHFVVQEIVRSEGIKVSESIIGKIDQKSKRKNSEDREEDYRRMGLDLVSGLTTEFCNVKKTATIDLDVLASSVSNLSDGMTKLQNLLRKDSLQKSGNFVHTMQFFLDYAEKNLKEVQEDEHRVLLHVREITEYFHGDISKDEANPLRIFVIVRDFLGMLDHVCKELRSFKVPNNSNPLAPFR